MSAENPVVNPTITIALEVVVTLESNKKSESEPVVDVVKVFPDCE